MYLFSKFPHRVNFVYGVSATSDSITFPDQTGKKGQTHGLNIKVAKDEDIFRIRFEGSPSGLEYECQTELKEPIWKQTKTENRINNDVLQLGGLKTQLRLNQNGVLQLLDKEGIEILSSLPQQTFGISGEAWLMQFRQSQNMRFFGLGEKSKGWERSNKNWRMWNVDVWADIPMPVNRTGLFEPDYISIPWLIIQTKKGWLGLLVDNSYAGMVSISPKTTVANQFQTETIDAPYFTLGAEGGLPSMYLLYADTLQDLTRRFQKLSGSIALPPLWSLGHQQCRWGYQEPADMKMLAQGFTKHQIPNDGLWMDIGYMDGFRVFSFNKKLWKDAAKEIATYQKKGFKFVPIIDPGVKQEKGYKVYDTGLEKDVFCKNPAGTDFIGIVWPGYTVFPDFSQEHTRTWWANWVAKFSKDNGIESAWLDMNDPSTGSVDCHAMLFAKGTKEHQSYHNEYAGLMSKATLEGFQKTNPNKRIFLLSRSGATGSQKWAANWTGDNHSNFENLNVTIAKSLSLSICGMPFNGPDVPGFGGEPTMRLARLWIQAGFLFPFLRNHCLINRAPQEPWAFKPEVRDIYAHYVRLRYKWMPYLYNQFINCEQNGDPVMRPLMYHYDDSEKLVISDVADQFLIGDAIMQAPILNEKLDSRDAVIPPGNWFRLDTHAWDKVGVSGARKKITAKGNKTPIWIKENAIIPMQLGWNTDNRKDLHKIELLLTGSPLPGGESKIEYHCDDGETLDYQKGIRSSYTIVSVTTKQGIEVTIMTLKENHKKVKFQFLSLAGVKLNVSIDGKTKILKSQSVRESFAGKSGNWVRWL